MTAPQFPAAWGQTPAPAPAQVPGYPPQAPPSQYAPQGWPSPNPYMPNPAPALGYPPAQQFGQPDPYAPPAFTPAGGTLDEYMNQRPAGAQFWKFPQPGHVNIGMVKRDLRDSDVAQVTFNGQPIRRKDGSISQEKSLSVPLVNPDGTESVMEFRGHQRTALEEAVSAGSGGARRLPEGGSMLRGTFTHTEPSRGGGSPKKIIKWEYVPADQVQQSGGLPAAAPTPQQAPPQQWQGNPIADPNTGQWGPPPAAPQQPAAAAPQQPAAAAPGHPQFDPNAYAAWAASQQGQAAPQQAAPPQQPAAPPAAAGYPQGQPAAVPSPNPAAGAQGAPAPQPYAAPGLDPQQAAMFAGLMGGAAPQG